MTVEVATTIATLDSTFPAATDPKSEGDDHIRLIKTVLKANVTSGPASSTDNTLPRFDGVTGKLLQSSGVVVDDSNNVGVGRSPNYRVDAYLAGSGSPAVAASNDSMVTVLQSVGTTQAVIGTLTSHPLVLLTANTECARIDTSGNLTLSAGVFGYGAGAGGTVTQATGKSTNVTLNKQSGKMIMNNAALAANTSVLFTFSNSFIGSTDMLYVQLDASGISDTSNYQLWASAGSGAAVVVLRNVSSGSLSEAVGIRFAVLKVSQS